MLSRVFPLPLKAYLVYQIVGSVLVNGAINYGFAWPLRRQPTIPTFGGWGSVAWDTCVSALLLSALTVVFGSYFVRRDLRDGKVRPAPGCLAGAPRLGLALRSTFLRALAFAAAFAPLGSAIAFCLLALFPDSLTFSEFVTFKLAFACTLGALVTPLNVLWVVSEKNSFSTAPSASA